MLSYRKQLSKFYAGYSSQSAAEKVARPCFKTGEYMTYKRNGKWFIFAGTPKTITALRKKNNCGPRATAKITECGDYIKIEVHWDAKVDRKHTGGWSVGKPQRGLAERLARAVNDQVAVEVMKPAILRDVDGKTYVNEDLKVSGRTMNADLKRLGY